MSSTVKHISLVRCRATSYGTFGRLFIDDVFECYTLEPCLLDPPSKPRAIAPGKYWISNHTVSPKYRFRRPYVAHGGCVPRLLNVPDFDGVLIHIGNFLRDTRGCILVGSRVSLTRLYDSTKAYLSLWSKIKDFVCDITITHLPGLCYKEIR